MTSLKPNLGDSKFSIRPKMSIWKNWRLELIEILKQMFLKLDSLNLNKGFLMKRS